MNRYIYYLFFVLFEVFIINNYSLSSNLLNLNNNCPCNPSIKTVFIPMSQGANLYTQYHKINYNFEDKVINADLSATYRFQQTSNGGDIALALFENNPLIFTGSKVQNRNENALIAEYFGLASNTNVSLNLSPRIRNQIIDLQFSLYSKQFWFQINVPVVKAQWQINKNNIPNNNFVGKEDLQGGGSLVVGSKNSGVSNQTDPTKNEQSNPNNFNLLNIYTINGSENTGPEDFSDMIDENLNTDGQVLSSEQNMIGIGSWGPVTYTASGLIPNPDYTGNLPLKEFIYEESELGDFDLTGEAIPVYTYDYEDENGNNNIAVSSFEINQKAVPAAPTLAQGLGGWIGSDQITRKYNLFNLQNDITTAVWGVADLQLWTGWDFVKKDKYHCGIYLKFVIPTGTIINQDWCVFAFNPVVGNGRHYELGIGASAHCDICANDSRVCSVSFDGYIAHPFNTTQFRTFDLCGDPMSRYAIVKALTYYGPSGDYESQIPRTFNYSDQTYVPAISNSNALEEVVPIKPEDVKEGTVSSSYQIEVPGNINDQYDYKNIMCPIGDINCGNISVGIGIKGEAILDFIYDCNNWKAGIGYAFSGQTAENCLQETLYNVYGGSKVVEGGAYYGYKGLTGITDLIVIGNQRVPNTLDKNDTTTPFNYTDLIDSVVNYTIDPTSPTPPTTLITQILSNIQNATSILNENNAFNLSDNIFQDNNNFYEDDFAAEKNSINSIGDPITKDGIPPLSGDIIQINKNPAYQYITPMFVKSNGDVAIDVLRGAYKYGISSRSSNGEDDAQGTTPEDVFILPNLQNNNTALMNGQMLNRIFGHIDYVWDSLWQPRIGILGSYGFTCNKYITAAYWDLGVLFGFSF
jgi:hypothetical protein